MFDNFDFNSINCGSGILNVYESEYDSLHIFFANECLIDAYWVPENGYYITLTRDSSNTPIAVYTCKTKEAFASFLQAGIEKMEIESKRRPYYGQLWETEYRSE